MLTAAACLWILAARCFKTPKQAAMSPRQSATFFASIVSLNGRMGQLVRLPARLVSGFEHPPTHASKRGPESRNKEQIMATAKQIPSVKATTSTRIPPWVGYVSPTCATIKLGKYFVTVEVTK